MDSAILVRSPSRVPHAEQAVGHVPSRAGIASQQLKYLAIRTFNGAQRPVARRWR